MAGRHSSGLRLNPVLLLTSVAVALLVVVIVVVISLLGGRDTSSQDGSQIPDNQLMVTDLYEGERLIPKFDIPTNQYDTTKFTQEGSFTCYEGAVQGVDVSEHQGQIDWQQVKDAGVEFAILRIGYRGMTEGGLNLDATFEQNYQGATAAGLKVGVYFFSQAITQKEAKEEAQYVLDALDGRALDYPVVFDWETPIPSETLPAEDLRAYDMDGEVISAMAKAFCQEIEKNGYNPCVYTNKHMAYYTFDLEALKDYPLWYAEYQPAPSLYYDFRIWQYSASATVPGISGSVDLNLCFEPY
ncbi:MAG: glycoside hydrolase family 25 protein [Acutalibacter sp.]|jgi:lysozyme